MRGKYGGSIINIGSVIGSRGNGGQSIYSASKAGLSGLTRSLAIELGPRNIRVNLIEPGYIDTDMTAGFTEEKKEALMKNISMGRLGSVEDVANVATFLASEKARYITGQVHPPNSDALMRNKRSDKT